MGIYTDLSPEARSGRAPGTHVGLHEHIAPAVAPDPLALLEEPTLAGVAERLVAEAQDAAGVPAALYVGDLEGARCAA